MVSIIICVYKRNDEMKYFIFEIFIVKCNGNTVNVSLMLEYKGTLREGPCTAFRHLPFQH
jgi:hypothetical protein